MNFEQRLQLRQEIARVMIQRESRVRRMWVRDAFGERMYLGGGSRPVEEQTDGYPVVRVDEEHHYG